MWRKPAERHQRTALRATARDRRIRRRRAISDRSSVRSASGEMPRWRSPSSTSEMLPVSSDTTIATASFSSVRPSAARCRVPSSRLTRGIHRQRQKAGGGRDAVALDDGRAVVQRRSGLKDARQQVVGDHRVERNAPFDVVAQADLPLDHDDRADPARRQVGRGRRRAPRSSRRCSARARSSGRTARGRSAPSRGGCRTGTAR